jgi:NlpC/P60 family
MPRLLPVTLGITFVLVSNASVAANERSVTPTLKQAVGRLLTRAEGAALVDLALENTEAQRSPDCSHLVHQALTSAGLVYPYATSFEIFAGIPQFRRVSTAQPGDLIVWRGHVGLVVDSEQRTFFSRTGSGPRTDEYTSDYWRGRGRPRFYRYVVGDRKLALLEPPVNTETATPVETVAEAGNSLPISDETDAPPDDSALHSNPVPENIQILAERGKPAIEDVEEGLSELTNASAVALENENHRRVSVMLVREFRVEKIQTKNGKGWAEVQVDSRAELSPDLTWKRARAQKLRWELRKDHDGWLLLSPKERLYIPQSAAVPAIARRLSTLSAPPAPPTTQRQLGSLASLLNFLLNEK